MYRPTGRTNGRPPTDRRTYLNFVIQLFSASKHKETAVESMQMLWCQHVKPYHYEFQLVTSACNRSCDGLWNLSSQPRPSAMPCALSLPHDYVRSLLAILIPPCMRHQLSPPAGQKERTRVQANNATKLEVERVARFNVYCQKFRVTSSNF